MSQHKVFANRVRQFIWPQSRCPVCGSLHNGCGLCDQCHGLLTKQNLCLHCPTIIPQGTVLCRECALGIKNPFLQGVSGYVYEGRLRNNILNFKYHNKSELHRPLALLLRELVEQRLPYQQFDLVLAVPVSKQTMERRGYNHMQLVAAILASELKSNASSMALRRVKNTRKLNKLNRSEREKELVGAFNADSKQVCGKNILLIDDIFTTGATARACTEALLAAGSKSVYLATIASAVLQSNEKYQKQIDKTRACSDSLKL